jgi:hypothetical protein
VYACEIIFLHIHNVKKFFDIEYIDAHVILTKFFFFVDINFGTRGAGQLQETRSGTPDEGSGGRGGPRAGGSGRRQGDRGRERKPNGEQGEERRRRARESQFFLMSVR